MGFPTHEEDSSIVKFLCGTFNNGSNADLVMPARSGRQDVIAAVISPS
jgi:hypothetical protein